MTVGITLLDLKYDLLDKRLLKLYESKVITREDIVRLTQCVYLTNLLVTPIDPVSKLPDELFREALILYGLDEGINPHIFTETVMKDLIKDYLKVYYKEPYLVRGNDKVSYTYLVPKYNSNMHLKVEGEIL